MEETGRITEQAFAKSLLTYAGFSENKRRLMLRRVKKKFTEDDEEASLASLLLFTTDDYLRRIGTRIKRRTGGLCIVIRIGRSVLHFEASSE